MRGGPRQDGASARSPGSSAAPRRGGPAGRTRPPAPAPQACGSAFGVHVPVVVAAAVICRSISRLHSAPSRGSTAAHRLPSAGSTGPAWPRAVRARPLGTGGHFRCVSWAFASGSAGSSRV